MSREPVLDFQELKVAFDGKPQGFLISTRVYRAKVPGGWLVAFWAGNDSQLIFYPDPEHAWDGGSLP